jgi:DNA-binding transcriptional ArsR family regulator
MVSLKEDKARKLTQTLSNDTCRAILEYLSSRKEATETQISKELNIPISTVHYNLKQLSESKLVTADEFHYSEKGKEVIHYKIANKYIIIAPEEDESLMEKLKSFIPAFVTVAAVSVGLFIYQIFTSKAQNILFENAEAPNTATNGSEHCNRASGSGRPKHSTLVLHRGNIHNAGVPLMGALQVEKENKLLTSKEQSLKSCNFPSTPWRNLF